MSNSRLFQPLRVGQVTLQHRLVMAPLTRFRADDSHVPLPFVKEYYAQRAAVPGTLLITEATAISKRAGGYANVPGIWSKEQVTAWREVTDAVHAKGSYIYVQLWNLGRVASPDVAKAEGIEIKGASPIALDSEHVVPKELTIEEIESFLGEYTQAAHNAVEAGFDGVEVHGANGYLIDQFFQDMTNQRQDRYGGSIENRARFGVEVATTLVSAIGADKVGFRLSPYSRFQGMGMKDPIPQFTHIIQELKKLKLSYLHLVEARIDGNDDVETGYDIQFAAKAWGKTAPFFIAGGFTPELARKAVDEDFKDVDAAVVFGRYFISTPDLPYRVKKGLPLNPYNRDTFYNAGSTVGYTDYPFSDEWLAESKA